MTTRTSSSEPCDTGTLALNALKEEGAFLHRARMASDVLAKRVVEAQPNVRTFTLSRDELLEISRTLTRSVDIAAEYHLDVAECSAA